MAARLRRPRPRVRDRQRPRSGGPVIDIESAESPHLGGYIEGGDPATYYPELWTWLVRERGVRSVLDVGCGDGVAVDYFAHQIGLVTKGFNMRVVGVEGIPQPDHALIVQHDYTEGPYVPPEPIFDLCWSCEFVEHVEEEFVPNFLETFAHADLLLMTHAEPGQGGYHHVNERPSSYWKEQVATIGFVFDAALTKITRALAAANDSPWNHYRRSGLAFRATR